MADEQMQAEGGDERETALLPASLFGSECKVGETYRVKVVGKYDDEVEVEHVRDKKEDKPKRDTMAGAAAEIDMMAQPVEAPAY